MKLQEPAGVSESCFYMWRAIFAISHADRVVKEEEIDFMHEALDKEDFSSAQKEILESDIEQAQDTGSMFMKIAEQKDRSQFFYYARMLCWSDGDFAAQEQEIILKLESLHVRNVDFDEMISTVDMTFDEDQKQTMEEDMQSGAPLVKFIRRFSNK